MLEVEELADVVLRVRTSTMYLAFAIVPDGGMCMCVDVATWMLSRAYIFLEKDVSLKRKLESLSSPHGA